MQPSVKMLILSKPPTVSLYCPQAPESDAPRTFLDCLTSGIGGDASYLKHHATCLNPRSMYDNLTRIQADYTHLFGFSSTALVPCAYWLGLIRNRLVQLFWSTPQPGWAKRVLFKAQLNACRKILVNDRGTGEELCTDWGAPREKMLFVPYPVDTEFFKPAQKCAESAPYIVIPGNSDRDEDVVVALAQSLDIDVVRVTAHLGTVRYYEQLKNRPARLKVKSQLTFPEVRELYQSAEAVVLPVRNRRHPAGLNALLEGMACGKTVLVPRGKTSDDYVEHGRTGLILDGGLAEAVAQVQRVLKSPARLAEIGFNARQHVLDCHTLEGLQRAWRDAVI